MSMRTKTPGLAGAAAILLVLSLSGVVAGANLVGDSAPSTKGLVNPTFEDIDGNGVDDDCQAEVVADPEAEAAAEAAVDTDGDGTISVSEAAHSDRIGGTNCNHGGYVSTVAHGADACTEPGVTGPLPPEGETGTETGTETDPDATAPDAPEGGDEAACAEDPTTEAATTTCEAPTEPAPAEEPTSDETTTVVGRNGHGKAVSEVAKSDAVGGKHCNHGGAVSEAAHADKEARDAAKAEAKAARDAAKAEAKAARDAAKAEARAARDAAKAAKRHGG